MVTKYHLLQQTFFDNKLGNIRWKNIEKQSKRDKLELLRWQEILNEKNIGKQVKRDKLELLRWQEILDEKI